MGKSPVRYLLDSVIVIDHFNGIAAATQFLQDHGAECALSVITRAEVLVGFTDDTEALAMEFLDAFPALPVTREIADQAARLRRSQRWRLPDAIQAAIALSSDLVLVTRNTRDFHDGDGGLAVLEPYRL